MLRNRFWNAAAAALAFSLSLSVPARSAENPDIPNFHQVNDHLYRGAQPPAPAFPKLAHLGVKTVIDLREGSDHLRWEEKLVKAAGMNYVAVPMNGMEAPSAGQLTKVFAVLDDSSEWPVFVHCRRGADRTGTVIACYRIQYDHWQNEKALTEAKIYGLSWIERGMQQFILRYPPAGNGKAPGASPSAF